MPFADPDILYNQIVDILNATDEGWGEDVNDPRRSPEAIRQAQIDSGYDVLRALAAHPENGRAAGLWTDVDVDHNTRIDGDVVVFGIPKIVAFEGDTAQTAHPADPDQIDSWRRGTAEVSFYSNTPHDQEDENGQPSSISGRYSLIDGLVKFTGHSCSLPVCVLTEEMALNKIPADLGPTVVKLSPPRVVKEGDNLFAISREYYAMGREDLIDIAGGQMKVRGVPSISAAQKLTI